MMAGDLGVHDVDVFFTWDGALWDASSSQQDSDTTDASMYRAEGRSWSSPLSRDKRCGTNDEVTKKGGEGGKDFAHLTVQTFVFLKHQIDHAPE
jgi:hypothetical protein